MPDALIRLSEPDQPVLAGPKRDAARAFANAALAPSTRGRRLRPVASVRLWLDAAEGPVFRPVLKGCAARGADRPLRRGHRETAG